MFWKKNKQSEISKIDGTTGSSTSSITRSAASQSQTIKTTQQKEVTINRGNRVLSEQVTTQTFTHQQKSGYTETVYSTRTPQTSKTYEMTMQPKITTKPTNNALTSYTDNTRRDATSSSVSATCGVRGPFASTYKTANAYKPSHSIPRPSNNTFTISNVSKDAKVFSTATVAPKPITATSFNIVNPTINSTVRPPAPSNPSGNFSQQRVINARQINPTINSTVRPPAPSNPSGNFSQQRVINARQINPTINSTVRPPAPSNPSGNFSQQQVINARQKYKLKPGIGVILNCVKFEKRLQEERTGSEHDVNRIKASLGRFKIQLKTYQNPTVKKIKGIVDDVLEKDFTKYSCLIFVILSHGTENDVVCAYDNKYNINETILHPLLKCPALADKPKILFIQACKGGIESTTMKTDAIPIYGLPTEVLKCYSTFEGYVAYRLDTGSPFITALCKELDENGHNTDIEQLMKNVTRAVQTKFEQVPSWTSTLTKPFILGDYI